jgi:hypothetical protein
MSHLPVNVPKLRNLPSFLATESHGKNTENSKPQFFFRVFPCDSVADFYHCFIVVGPVANWMP